LCGTWIAPELLLPRELGASKASAALCGGPNHSETPAPAADAGAVLLWLRTRACRSSLRAQAAQARRLYSCLAALAAPAPLPQKLAGARSTAAAAASSGAELAPSTLADCLLTVPQLAHTVHAAVAHRCLLALTGLCNAALREAAPTAAFPFVRAATAMVAARSAAVARHETAAAVAGLLRNLSCTDQLDVVRGVVAAGAIHVACAVFNGPWPELPWRSLRDAAAALVKPASDTSLRAADAAGTSQLLLQSSAAQQSAAAAAIVTVGGGGDTIADDAPEAAGSSIKAGSGDRVLDALLAARGGRSAAASGSDASMPGVTRLTLLAAAGLVVGGDGTEAAAAPAVPARIHGDDARLAEDLILSVSNLVRFGACMCKAGWVMGLALLSRGPVLP